jgi:hypothetical protein
VSEGHRDPDADPHGYADADPHRDPDADPHLEADPHPDPDADADADPDPDGNRDGHRDGHAHAHADGNADRPRDGNSNRDSDAVRAGRGRDQYPGFVDHPAADQHRKQRIGQQLDAALHPADLLRLRGDGPDRSPGTATEHSPLTASQQPLFERQTA